MIEQFEVEEDYTTGKKKQKRNFLSKKSISISIGIFAFLACFGLFAYYYSQENQINFFAKTSQKTSKIIYLIDIFIS